MVAEVVCLRAFLLFAALQKKFTQLVSFFSDKIRKKPS